MFNMNEWMNEWMNEAKCHGNRTHFDWPPKQTGWWQENKKSQSWPTMLYSNGIRNLGALLDCRLNMTQHVSSTARTCFFHLRRIRQVRRCLNKTCRRILIQALDRHLPTRLLPLCPLRSVFIHATTLILGYTHCCSPNKRSQTQR